MEAIGMYLGDGKLSADDKHLGFASIDPDMIKFVLDFFNQKFGIGMQDITISIRYREFRKDVLNKWSKYLQIPFEKLRIRNNGRTRNEACEFQISGVIFRYIFGKIIDEITSSDFLRNSNLRRAFLRGIFAAEGNIAINRKVNYIVCIQFCLSYHEDNLANLIKKGLELEGITYYETKREKDTSRTIVITNWANYHKCWKIDLFRLNARKELSFLNKLKITKFSCKIPKSMKERLYSNDSMSQRQLAFLVGTNPALFCNKKSTYVNIEYLITLAKIASVSTNDLKASIEEFRVNKITPINDRQFIDFIFDLKAYT